MDEKLLHLKNFKKLDLTDLYAALKILLAKQTTNFESLIKNIENNEEIFKLVEKIIFKGDDIAFSDKNPIIEKCILYGILKNENGRCKVHN